MCGPCSQGQLVESQVPSQHRGYRRRRLYPQLYPPVAVPSLVCFVSQTVSATSFRDSARALACKVVDKTVCVNYVLVFSANTIYYIHGGNVSRSRGGRYMPADACCASRSYSEARCGEMSDSNTPLPSNTAMQRYFVVSCENIGRNLNPQK